MLDTAYSFTLENAGAITISEHRIMWPRFIMTVTLVKSYKKTFFGLLFKKKLCLDLTLRQGLTWTRLWHSKLHFKL